MPWITLTADDLSSVLAGPEIEKIGQAALRLGQDDPIESAIAEASSEARGYIAAYPRNQLGAGVSIPDRIKGKVLDIAAHRVLTRVLQTPNKARQARYEDAIRFLERVAGGKFEIEWPEDMTPDPLEDGPKYPPPRVQGPQRQFRRGYMDGM